MENVKTLRAVPIQLRKPVSVNTSRLVLFFASLFAFVLLLSYFSLSQQSLRLDEAQSIWQSSHTPIGVLQVLAQDVHVPLYQLLLHFWQFFFGNQVATMRLLSLLFFLASIPLLYQLAKTIYNSRVAMFATLLFACSPFLNWYGNELRMYSLLVLLAIANQLLFIKIFNAGRKSLSKDQLLYAWWGYGLVSLLGIYTHYFFWLLLLTEGVFFLLNRKEFPPRSLVKFAAVAISLLLLIAPWIWFLLQQQTAQNQTPLLARPGTINIFNAFSQFFVGFQSDHFNTLIISVWPISVLLGFLAMRKMRRVPKETVFLLLSIFLPIAVAFAISILFRPVFLTRYLILATPSLYIFIAWFLSLYPPKFSFILKFSLVGLMLTTLYVQTSSANTPTKENYEHASSYIARRATPQDIIVLSAPFTIYPFEYYYQGTAAITTLPAWNPYQFGPIPGFSEDSLALEVSKLKTGHDKIWLLLSYDQGYQETIRDYFEHNYQRIEYRQFSPGMSLYVYKLNY